MKLQIIEKQGRFSDDLLFFSLSLCKQTYWVPEPSNSFQLRIFNCSLEILNCSSDMHLFSGQTWIYTDNITGNCEERKRRKSKRSGLRLFCYYHPLHEACDPDSIRSIPIIVVSMQIKQDTIHKQQYENEELIGWQWFGRILSSVFFSRIFKLLLIQMKVDVLNVQRYHVSQSPGWTYWSFHFILTRH